MTILDMLVIVTVAGTCVSVVAAFPVLRAQYRKECAERDKAAEGEA